MRRNGDFLPANTGLSTYSGFAARKPQLVELKKIFSGRMLVDLSQPGRIVLFRVVTHESNREHLVLFRGACTGGGVCTIRVVGVVVFVGDLQARRRAWPRKLFQFAHSGRGPG